MNIPLIGLRRSAVAGSLFFITLFVPLITLSDQAQAHVIASGNGVSAVLHIVPADDPVAGTPTEIGLEFSSTLPHFDLRDYTTTATVKGVSVSVLEPPTTVSSSLGQPLYGTATVMFPEPGSYTIAINGSSTQAGDNPFTITYTVRAEQPLTTASASSDSSGAGFDAILISAASLGLLAVVAQYNIRQGGRYSS